MINTFELTQLQISSRDPQAKQPRKPAARCRRTARERRSSRIKANKLRSPALVPSSRAKSSACDAMAMDQSSELSELISIFFHFSLSLSLI